jgi:hypothetical protein
LLQQHKRIRQALKSSLSDGKINKKKLWPGTSGSHLYRIPATQEAELRIEVQVSPAKWFMRPYLENAPPPKKGLVE